MLFNTWTFGLFFLLVYGTYWAVPKRLQNVLLVLASYAFYSFWDWRFLSLILISTVTDYLDLPYHRQMAEGRGTQDTVPQWEQAWKGRSLEKITASRVGQWRRELTPEQLRWAERWGGHALRTLGYELTTDRAEALPWAFFPRLYWKQFLWRARCACRLAGRELLTR